MSTAPAAHQTSSSRSRRPRILRALLAAGCGLLVAAPAQALAADGGNGKTVCAYTNHSLAGLQSFDSMVHRDVNCAMVYNNSAPDWANWENPWFLRNTGADSDFKDWATAPGTSRRVIITQDFFPRSLDNTDWRAPGAAGAYTAHAVTLAQNLVAAGLGGATIRLAHEANGTDYPHNIGNSPQEYAEWVQMWRKTALAMKSVPGAHFLFDWCILAQYRAIPLSQFYPGDDVVDIVGIDAYDTGSSLPAGTARWNAVYGRTEGIGDIVNFAKAHNKSLSIPEWGVSPVSNAQGGGDDPAYVDGIAKVVRTNRVSYQSYFYKYSWATQLAGGPASLASYIRHFSATGDSGPGSTPTAADLASDSAATPTAKAASSKSARAKAKAKAKARLSRVLEATAGGALAKLVKGGKLRKPRGSVKVKLGSGMVCVLASVSASRRATIATSARTGCATQAWSSRVAKRRVVASGSASLTGSGSGHLAMLSSSSSARRGIHGRVRLTVVAVFVPNGGTAVAISRQRRVNAN